MKINLTNEIEALVAWREERHLSAESQAAGFKGNFFEEVAEFYRATNDHERVDALCDMLVFLINANDIIITNKKEVFELKVPSWYGVKSCELLLNNVITLVAKCGCAGDGRVQANYLLTAIMLLGYNPQKCLAETIKEISSRTGSFDESINKFVKDTSDEAKAKWYKADYSKCK